MTGPAAILVNISSGLHHTHGKIAELVRAHQIAAEVVMVSPGTNIAALAARLIQEGRRTIIAAGGDGTVSAVASAVLNTDAALGVLPMGTLNHFARDLKMPLGLEDALITLQRSKPRMVDVAEVNGRIFINNSGLGLYPWMVSQREKRRKQGQPKWLALIWASLAALRRFPFLKLRVVAGGKSLAWRTPFVFVGNNTYRMDGVGFGSRDSLDKGVLSLGVAQYRMGRWGLVRLAFRALVKEIGEERDFMLLRADEVRIYSRRRRLAVSLDGEVALIETPLEYRTRPGALRVIAPEAG
jgi:diacylglycerol kinase family enzyme